jgi:hypothetical protein
VVVRAQVRNILIVAALLVMSAATGAQRPASPEPAQLPVRRVVLYKSGVGFFEHLGNVTGSGEIAIQFTSGQLNDALKSLTALDLDRGAVSAISYNSVAPIEQQLAALRLPLGTNPNSAGLYEALRGTRVDVRSRTGTIVGRILSVERRERTRSDGSSEPVDVLTVVADDGAVRHVTIDPDVTVRIDERDVRGDLGRYLSVIASGRSQDVRRMVISTSGAGTRRLLVSYISEVPVWKSTYRLVLPDAAADKPLLQGWAIVDNTVGEDWTNVELSLVAGAPQSFIQDISQPFYTRRPVVALPNSVQRTPQTHEATLQAGSGTVRGIARDSSGAVLPGVTVQLRDQQGTIVATTTTDSNGQYQLNGGGGSHSLTASLPGFRTVQMNIEIFPGASPQADLMMTVGGLQETISVTGDAPRVDTARGRGGIAGGVAGGVVGRMQAAAPPSFAPQEVRQARDESVAAASAQELGDLFEYKLKQPVTIRKNQSALVPILSSAVEAERVSTWRGTPGSGRPLRAVWLTNGTGLTLDGGSLSVIEANAFAGEGLVEPLKPGEKRLVSYGTDLAVTVDARLDQSSGRFTRVTAREGVMIAQQEERNQWVYRVRNEDTTPRTLIVEHPVRQGWTLAPTPVPAETTVSAARFRITVPAKGESTLTVSERRVLDSRYSLEQVDDRLITTITQRGIVPEALRQALQPVLDKRAELATAERALTDLNAQITAIGQDQARVRQNLQVLKGSAEEKTLVKRYTTELNQQEDRLAAIRQQLADATGRRDARRAELSQLIQQLAFVLDAPASS